VVPAQQNEIKQCIPNPVGGEFLNCPKLRGFRSLISQADCGMISRIFRTGGNDRFSIQETSFPFIGLLRDLQSKIEQRGLTSGPGKADTLALRSRFTYTPSGFRRLLSSLTSLINSGNAACRCRFVVEKNPEKGGKVRKTLPAKC
jgi:hypothetical protein